MRSIFLHNCCIGCITKLQLQRKLPDTNSVRYPFIITARSIVTCQTSFVIVAANDTSATKTGTIENQRQPVPRTGSSPMVS